MGTERRPNWGVGERVGVFSGVEGMEGVDGGSGDEGRELKVATSCTSVAG